MRAYECSVTVANWGTNGSRKLYKMSNYFNYYTPNTLNVKNSFESQRREDVLKDCDSLRHLQTIHNWILE